MMERDKAITEIGRLRNRHIAKLLTFLGDTPEYLQSAIKRSYSIFAQDVADNVVDENQQSHTNTNTQQVHEQGDDYGHR